VKALSLMQPWASLVAVGAKRVETRSWTTHYRGPVAIHASKGWPKAAKDLVWQEPFLQALRDAELIRFNIFAGYAGEGEGLFPLGAIIATAELVEICSTNDEIEDFLWKHGAPFEYEFGDYNADRYAWALKNVKRLPEPVAARGSLGLWEWDETPALTAHRSE
jgi:activating signal cointegrator 1